MALKLKRQDRDETGEVQQKSAATVPTKCDCHHPALTFLPLVRTEGIS